MIAGEFQLRYREILVFRFKMHIVTKQVPKPINYSETPGEKKNKQEEGIQKRQGQREEKENLQCDNNQIKSRLPL